MGQLLIWVLNVNGSTNACGSVVGIILKPPGDTVIEHFLRFGFQATNNEVEYKALIAKLKLTQSLRA